jgi:tRNA (adenine22-N1)-methyltransferase
MQLSKRLQAVADLVTKGNRVADVGCDHAYISIYLAENEISPHIIAMDVNQGPVDRARENIIKYGCDNLIEVRKSDGLEKLKEDEADTIIIAGMGGALTVQILTQHPGSLSSICELVLQPQSEIYKVRQMLSECSFIIIDETMVKEDGKYYFMMKAMRSENAEIQEAYRLDQKEHLYFGKLLLEKKNPILKEYLLWDYGICEEIIRSLHGGQSENSRQKQKEIEERMELIQVGLNYFD